MPVIISLCVIVLALLLGSHLKAESDRLAELEASGEWSLDTEIATPIIHIGTPVLRAGYALPGGTLQKVSDTTYGGVTLYLGSSTSPLPYTLQTDGNIGVTYAPDAPDLAAHVSALRGKGLYVIGVFDVTSFDTADTALRTYRKGIEMSLLTLFAQAGVNDILLRGLPLGDDTADAQAVAYVKEVKHLWATLPQNTPALGVSLPPIALQSDTNQEDGSPIYAGELTPGRLLKVCDYLALDTSEYGGNIDDLLRGMQYVYMRYSLRLLMPTSHSSAIECATQRGFGRIFEWKK